jgi:hypothetical protein
MEDYHDPWRSDFFFWLSLCLLLCGFPELALAQSQQPPVIIHGAENGVFNALGTGEQQTNPKTPGSSTDLLWS